MGVTIFVGVIILITHALEAITGFGCTVLAVPFVTAAIGMEKGIPLLAVVAWILALYIVITQFKKINFKQFLIIVGFVGLGMPVGIYIFNNLDPGIMKKFLAVFIVVVSIIQLKKLFFPPQIDKPLPKIFYYVILVLGGIIHGAFASGGPFVVLYASRALKDKGEFRATLCLLWTTLNTVLIITYLKTGIFNTSLVKDVGVMLPFLAVGIVVGEIVHNKVDELLFKKIVFIVLLITGSFMLFL